VIDAQTEEQPWRRAGPNESGVVGVTIVEFLTARLAEDETRASKTASLRAVLDDPSRNIDQPSRTGAEFVWRGAGLDAVRMVREVEAKRRIIFLAVQMPELSVRTATFDKTRGAWADVLRALASVYATHPDYDQAWAAQS
jgi:hypothetical protein